MVDWIVNLTLISLAQLNFLNAWRCIANMHYVQSDPGKLFKWSAANDIRF